MMSERGNPIVSIIVPIYKVEKYLPECINSILNQTYRDIQIILVDDGSPDNCGTICDEYAQKDKRILVLHKANGGVSSARNLGLAHASGKYVTFCDSDDSYRPDWIKMLVNAIDENGSDAVVGGYIHCCDDNTEDDLVKHQIGMWITDTEIHKAEYCFKMVMSEIHGWEIWDRMFRMDIIRDNCIRFCETCNNYAEDLGFVLSYSLYASTVLGIENCGYKYRIRNGSMMQSTASAPKLESLHQVFLSVEPVCKNCLSPRVIEQLLPVLYIQMVAGQFMSKIWSSGLEPDDLRKKAIDNVHHWDDMYGRLNLPLMSIWNPYRSGSYNLEIFCHIRYLLSGSWIKLRIQCKLIRAFRPVLDSVGKMINSAKQKNWWGENMKCLK